MKRGTFVQAKWGLEWSSGRIMDTRGGCQADVATAMKNKKNRENEHGIKKDDQHGSINSEGKKGRKSKEEVLIRFQGRGKDGARWVPLHDTQRLRPQEVLRELIPSSHGVGIGFPKPGDKVVIFSADAVNASCLRARGHALPGVVLQSLPARDACKVGDLGGLLS